MKFSKTSDRSAIENCRHFVSAVSPQIPVREMTVAAGPESDSQVQMEDSQVVSPDSQQVSKGTKHDAGYSSTASAAASGLTLPDLAQKVARLLESGDREGRGEGGCVGVCRGLVQQRTIPDSPLDDGDNVFEAQNSGFPFFLYLWLPT